MLPFVVLGLAALGLTGCASAYSSNTRKTYPEHPDPQDPLSTDPCSVSQDPRIILKGSGRLQQEINQKISKDLTKLKAIQPELLCGLERIEVLNEAEFVKHDGNPHVNGLYSPQDRVIRLKNYSSYTLFHEVGHHAHNLGFFSKATSDFFSIKVNGQDKNSNFISTYAATNPKEDWAETFATALAYPLMTGIKIYYNEGDEISSVASKSQSIHKNFNLPLFPITKSMISLGESAYFPNHEAFFSVKEKVFLYDPKKNEWSQFSQTKLFDTGGTETQRLNYPGMLADYDGIRLAWQGSQGIFYHENPNYFSGITASSDLFFQPSDPHKNERKIHFRITGTPIGHPFEENGVLKIFRKTQNKITLHHLDLETFSEKKELSLGTPSQDFRPLHIMSLKDGNDFLVLGKLEHQHKVQFYTLRPADTSKKDYQWIPGGEIKLPSGQLETFRLPAQQSHHILIPFGDWHFLHYDLKTNKFSLVQPGPSSSQLPKEKVLELIPSGNHWHAVTWSDRFHLGFHEINFSF